jgi:hypothetical protein
LSVQSNLIVVGSNTVKAFSVLSATTILVPTPTLTVRGIPNVLSGLSNMTVVGALVNTVTGTVTLTLQSGLVVVAAVSPPWIWPFIEIDPNTVSSQDGTSDATGWDSKPGVNAGNEIIIIVTGMEGA